MKNVLKNIIVAIITFEARLLLSRHNPKIIAITGSVGKTATKDAIYTVLKQTVSVRKSEKSANSEIGIPLTILGLQNGWSNPIRWTINCFEGLAIALFSQTYPEVLVIEVGVDRPGDMEQLTQWLKPDMVVLTRLPDVPAHVEHFASPEAVITEKMQLVSALRNAGVLIYNHDDMVIQSQLPSVRQRCVGYARYTEAMYRIGNDRTVYHDDRPVGISLTVTTSDQVAEVKVHNVIGMQLAYIFAAAIAVGGEFEISAQEAAKRLADFTPPPGRMRVLEGIKGSLLIDDTYNSSPVAVESALQTLNEVKYAKRKIAVLGDMLELGKYSVEQHERMGRIAAKTTDILITVGVRSRKIALSALESGMSEKNIFQYEEVDRAGRELQNMLQPGDVVLVKASQSIRAENIVEEVMAQPELASELLVRQSKEWKRR